MNVRMYVVTHKLANIPTIKGYIPILVGAISKPEVNKYSTCDCIGENISEKNPNYCELTGLYWIWKNTKGGIVGLCHYRRYFTKAHISTSAKYYLSSNDIEKELSKFDVIVPKRRFYEKSIIDSVNIAPNKADMEIIRKAIQTVSPEYYDDYITFINNNETYLYNMCIMRKGVLDEYCIWLFEILFYIEERYDISKEDPYRSRLFGFLSERLLYIWIRHNISPKKIREVRVVMTDENTIRSIAHEMKNYYRDILWRLRKEK